MEKRGLVGCSPPEGSWDGRVTRDCCHAAGSRTAVSQEARDVAFDAGVLSGRPVSAGQRCLD